jgi:hypothetical protein
MTIQISTSGALSGAFLPRDGACYRLRPVTWVRLPDASSRHPATADGLSFRSSPAAGWDLDVAHRCAPNGDAPCIGTGGGTARCYSDSQSVTTTEKGERGGMAGKRSNRRNRHLLVSTLGLLLSVGVYAAEGHDWDGDTRSAHGCGNGSRHGQTVVPHPRQQPFLDMVSEYIIRHSPRRRALHSIAKGFSPTARGAYRIIAVLIEVEPIGRG